MCVLRKGHQVKGASSCQADVAKTGQSVGEGLVPFTAKPHQPNKRVYYGKTKNEKTHKSYD